MAYPYNYQFQEEVFWNSRQFLVQHFQITMDIEMDVYSEMDITECSLFIA